MDEGGGYYDSGFIQALDFFGDGPRIPLIAVSPFSKGGHIKHSYGDHASLVKFIERNWGHGPLSGRSRDILPNPQFDEANPNVPHNMPALSDLFDMFNFQNPNARSDIEQLKSGGQVFGRIVVRFEDIGRLRQQAPPFSNLEFRISILEFEFRKIGLQP